MRLPPEVEAQLSAFCEAVGISRNGFIEGVITDALPALEQLAEAAALAKKGLSGPAARRLSQALQAATVDLSREGHQLQFELGGIGKKKPQRSVKRRGRIRRGSR